MKSPSQQQLNINNSNSSFGRIDSMNGINNYDDDDEMKGNEERIESRNGIRWNDDDSNNNNTWEYKKLYTALKDLESYNVSISIPEFIFIGFQSSGKTSAVSQAAKLPVGVMKNGTASRCPTRFKLINNKSIIDKPLIKVNGVICKNEYELTLETIKIHNKYEEKKIFSKNIIEVRIEWCNSPELTFIDLPGLISGNNREFIESKKQIDKLTLSFLHETSCNNGHEYKYIPILVVEPNDKEHDKNEVINYISNLIENDIDCPDYKKRIDWKSSTLFIINKFDRQISRSPASNLIDYMNYICNVYGGKDRKDNTILTMFNPYNENTSTMNHKQLYEFVLGVKDLEEKKWNETLKQFKNLDDENLYQLIQMKNEKCGINKMNKILELKMCNIAKKCIPNLERQLEIGTKNKEIEISNIIKQIEMCNPLKLKTECIQFGTLFMKLLKEYYNGSLIPYIDPKNKKSWAKEVNDFHIFSHSHSNIIINWEQEIQPNKLIKLLSNPKISSKPKVSKLLTLLKMNLMGSSAINRIIDVWKCQVGYMLFPIYTNEDIINIAGGFDSCRQPPLWTSIRNVVLASVGRLANCVKHLAEMFRYKLKENADIIFEYTLVKKYGKLENIGENNAIIVLLQRTLRDYKKEIDNLINEFNQSTQVDPKIASILDQELCEETVLIGKLISKSMQKSKEKEEEKQAAPIQHQQPQKPKPKKQQQQQPNDDEIIPHLYNLGYDHGDIQNALQSVSNPKDINEIIEYIAKNDNKNNKTPSKKRRPINTQKAEEKKDISDDESQKKEEQKQKQEEEIKPKMGYVISNNDNNSYDHNNNYNSSMYDNDFYESMNASDDNNFSLLMNSTSYDVNLIKKLSCIFYQVIKQRIIRDVITKISNRIMRYITQDNRLEDAVHTGVDRRSIQTLLNKLVEKTGIDVAKLEKLIENESTIKIPRSINDLDNQELKQIYGIDRKRLEKIRDQKINDLKQYNLLKTKTLNKIYHIKNNQYDKIKNDQEQQEEEEEEQQQQEDIGNNISQ